MGLIVDNFAGGGGASTGLELGLARKVDIAINHDPDAIAMHKVNHPETKHYQESVWDIDPIKVCDGKEVDVAWFSPDCKHFSKAKGKKPVDKHIRGLAWIALRWAGTVRPKIIFLENVEEFKTWGPVRRGRPVKAKAGQTFDKFISQLESLGYKVEHRELIAADYGAPTKRKRFFMVARCDGQEIKWPKPLYAPRQKATQLGLRPYKSAASIIDFSIECPSIFERKKPLTEATLKRIARGYEKFVIEEKKPFIVPIGYGENKNQAPRIHCIDEPLPTAVSSGKHYLVTPYLIDYHFQNKEIGARDPYPTITSVRGHYLCAPILLPQLKRSVCIKQPITSVAYLVKHFGGTYKGSGASLEDSLPTITSVDHNALVEVKIYGKDHSNEVNAFLMKYYKNEDNSQSLLDPLHTVTSKSRFALIEIEHIKYQVVDIGMRMLTPRELYNAQGFPPDYIIDVDSKGNKYPINKQIARCGNAVPPPFAEQLVRANFKEQESPKEFNSMQEMHDFKQQLSLF